MFDSVRSSRTGLFAAALMLLASGAPACGQGVAGVAIIGPNDVDAMVEIARGYGSAEAERTDAGEPVMLGTLNGTAYQVFFLDCREGRDCRSLSFYAIWDTPGVTLEMVNEWNRTDPFHKAYLSEDNFPVVELNASIVGGVTRTNFDDLLSRWTVAVAAFETTVVAKAP